MNYLLAALKKADADFEHEGFGENGAHRAHIRAAIAKATKESAVPSERDAMRWRQIVYMVERGVAPDVLVDWINHPKRLDYAAELRAEYG